MPRQVERKLGLGVGPPENTEAPRHALMVGPLRQDPYFLAPKNKSLVGLRGGLMNGTDLTAYVRIEITEMLVKDFLGLLWKHPVL